MPYEGPKAPSSEEVAVIIVRNIFERGPNRLSSQMRTLAVQSIAAACREWKGQLLAEADGRLTDAQNKAVEYKRELQEVKLRLTILEKER